MDWAHPQNKTLNFAAPDAAGVETGGYVHVGVTTAFPNSLVGEMVI